MGAAAGKNCSRRANFGGVLGVVIWGDLCWEEEGWEKRICARRGDFGGLCYKSNIVEWQYSF